MKSTRYVLSLLLLFSCTYGVFAQQVPKDLDGQIIYYAEEGSKAYEAGNYADAIASLEKVKEILKINYGNNDINYATVVNTLGFLYQAMGNYAQAEPLFKEALAIRKKALGEEHPDYATSLNNLALLYQTMGNYAQAEPLYKEALAIREKVLGEEHPDFAISLNNLAFLYSALGIYAQAEPLYKDALAITKKALGEEHPDYASILNNLTLLYQAMGNYALAEPLSKEALAIRKKTLGEEHPDYATSLNSLAFLHESMGNYAQAEPLYKDALAIRKKALGEDHPDFAISINNLAGFYYNIGNYAQAEPLFKEALSITKKALGEAHPTYATSLNNLAVLYKSMGNYELEEPLYKEALAIRKKTLGEAHPDYATPLNNLATLHERMGNFAQAEPLYKEALAIRKKALGEDHPDYATSLNNLAGLYQAMGNYAQAEPLYKEALAIRKKSLGEDHLDYATSLNNLAVLYKSMGNYEQAEPLYKEALAIRKKALGVAHPDYATHLSNLAGLYSNIGNYEQAEPLYKEALAIRKKTLGEAHPDYAISLSNLASFHVTTQNHSSAYPLFTKAQQIYQNQITHNFTWLSEKQREQYFKTIGYNFQAFHSFAYQAHKTIPQTLSDDYNYQLLTKGLQLATSLQMRNRIAGSGDPTLQSDYENWLGQRRFLGKLYEKTIEQRINMGINIDSLEDAANRVEADMSRRSEVFAEATDTTRYTWKDVQKQLKSNEAAVEIARFNWYNEDWTDTVYYAMMVVTSQTNEHPDVVWLTYGNELESRDFKNYASALQRGENDFDSYLQYWKPLDSLLQGAEKVYLSLDGIYHKINLETLITPEGKYLGDVKELHLVGSTKDLVKSRPATTSSLSALLIGNPAYSADSTQLSSAAMPFKNPNATDAYLPDNTRSTTYQLKELPATKAEIDSIGAVLTKQGYRVHAYSGKQAVEEAVKSANSPRILHLATHGAFLADPSPNKQDNTRLLMGMDLQRATENPLLRSQLYFSGAQETLAGKYPIDATYDNGILTAYEAVNINLQGTELVVLSACETGLGEVRNGEGVFGLQRAFQVAGARSVMMSLWKVDDSATSLFMSTFYRQWLQTGDKRQAFKATQQVLRNHPNYKHPYYWGAFVLVGE